jgi:hypothetical protein
MSNTNTGGPAFPLPSHTKRWNDVEKCYVQDEGMTLRDYIAAKAMPSVYKEYAECARNTGWDEDWRMWVALDAYALADAMLKAREQ